MTPPTSLARRAFLRRVGQLGAAGVATPWALNLATMGEAAAADASDYKALVCIFLYGGNDHGNTLVPYEATGHAQYAAARLTLATPRENLAATALTGGGLPPGRQYALAPQLAPLKPLFDARKLALQLNVGPLIQPTTLDQFHARSVPLPPKLFSHNDQQSVWQSSGAEGAVHGWGGSLGDLALAGNGQSLFTCISVTGNAVFLAGAQAMAYQIGAAGPVPISAATDPNGLYGTSTACRDALQLLITQSRTHVLESDLNAVTTRAIAAQGSLGRALTGGPDFSAQLPDVVGAKARSLNRQLKMVARLIAARAALGLKRQVFMVSLNGFDTHDGLLTRHPALLTQLGAAMAGFQNAIDAIGMGPNVTTFTASDFGRTLSSNGDGSDHGWGGHHVVMGGAVKGGTFYGQAPAPGLDGPEDVGQGRLLPSTSVDQYAATLARWFGVPEVQLPWVSPYLGNFSAETRNLGFL
ncbi:MAG: DUF1501 domain-containing protein [Proteobacteria bacterium]|nr:DUF1501 domain-containing protein [Pseudomonadota bacterium]